MSNWMFFVFGTALIVGDAYWNTGLASAVGVVICWLSFSNDNEEVIKLQKHLKFAEELMARPQKGMLDKFELLKAGAFPVGKILQTKAHESKDVIDLSLDPTSFAPGVWAGMEGSSIRIKNREYEVLYVDFDRKMIGVSGYLTNLLGEHIYMKAGY